MAFNLKEHLAQPSTILGIGTAAAAISGIVAHVLTHDTTAAIGAGMAAFAIVQAVLPDNTAAQSSVEKLVTDVVTAAANKKLAAAIPLLVSDGMSVVAALSPQTQQTTVTTTTVATPAPAPAPVIVPPVAMPAVSGAMLGQTVTQVSPAVLMNQPAA